MIPCDTNGNQILCNQSGKDIIVTLKLKEQVGRRNYPRKLGTIDCEKRILVTKRNYRKHIMKANLSYGFNHFLLKEATKFDHILLEEKDGKERHRYLIPRQKILEEGTFLHFKQIGFEKQIFLSYEKIKTYELQ